jgi:hypothetical protein
MAASHSRRRFVPPLPCKRGEGILRVRVGAMVSDPEGLTPPLVPYVACVRFTTSSPATTRTSAAP